MTSTNAEEKADVTVSYSKLVEGIGTVFAGVLTMLEAVDPKTANKLVEHFVVPDSSEETSAGTIAEKEANTNATEDAGNGVLGAAPVPSDISAPVGGDAPAEVTEETPVSTISQDDITKIIVQKIKQNRSNNEKIGAILKTYGVTKVSDLPASKYEAFVTDLSAI